MQIVEIPAPPLQTNPRSFKSDKIVGVVIMVLGALSFLWGILALLLGSMLAPGMNDMRQEVAKEAKHDPFSETPVLPWDTIFSITGVIVIVIAVLQIASGIGVFKSSKRGLIFALAIAGVSVFGGAAGIAVGVGIGLYAILRLWGNVGPPPV